MILTLMMIGHGVFFLNFQGSLFFSPFSFFYLLLSSDLTSPFISLVFV